MSAVLFSRKLKSHSGQKRPEQAPSRCLLHPLAYSAEPLSGSAGYDLVYTPPIWLLQLSKNNHPLAVI